jgi:flagellar basal-body rod modification protein FlgD
MPSISALTGGDSASTNSQATDIRDLEVGQFLDLLIAQLQNQDPLEPMENSEMMAQIAQMREISSTDQLTETLDAMVVGQQLSTATSMIGKRVQALTDDGTNVEGVVDRVSVEINNDDTRSLRIHIGADTVSLSNIREVVPASE